MNEISTYISRLHNHIEDIERLLEITKHPQVHSEARKKLHKINHDMYSFTKELRKRINEINKGGGSLC